MELKPYKKVRACGSHLLLPERRKRQVLDDLCPPRPFDSLSGCFPPGRLLNRRFLPFSPLFRVTTQVSVFFICKFQFVHRQRLTTFATAILFDRIICHWFFSNEGSPFRIQIEEIPEISARYRHGNFNQFLYYVQNLGFAMKQLFQTES